MWGYNVSLLEGRKACIGKIQMLNMFENITSERGK